MRERIAALVVVGGAFLTFAAPAMSFTIVHPVSGADHADAFGFSFDWAGRSSKHFPFEWSGPGD